MNQSEFRKLAGQILPELPGFGMSGAMMTRRPVGPILSGIRLEPSGFSKSAFYLTVFSTALYVPSDTLSFHFAIRLHQDDGNGGWDTSLNELPKKVLEAIRAQAIPFLERHTTPEQIAEAVAESEQNPQYIRLAAYSYAHCGDKESALERLRLLDAAPSTTHEWDINLRREATTFCALLSNDLGAAKKQLHDWEVLTRRNLKIVT